MISPESRLSCRIDGLTGVDRERQRLNALASFGLLEAGSVPVFDEATQMAARFLEVPICVLSILDRECELLKSAVGLSRLGLMNQLAASRQIPRLESFGTHVVDSQQVLIVTDTLSHPAFNHSVLVQQYGIRAYLGVPLLSSDRRCLGVLAIMDLAPREFSFKDVEFLELEARWTMSEFERAHLLQQEQASASASQEPTAPPSHSLPSLVASMAPAINNSVRVELIAQLAQELRTPLTSIMGMTSVLGRKIYGPLTDKQQEYIDIMRDSGQCLLSLVDEIMELGSLDDQSRTLSLTPVDVEMVCQQAIKTLTQFAQRQDQEIHLSVEPGPRIWLLDKDKVRQMLYHLTFSVIHCSCAGSVVHIHVSRKQNRLNIAVWVSNPWLGGNFSSLSLYPELSSIASNGSSTAEVEYLESYAGEDEEFQSGAAKTALAADGPQANRRSISRESLGLLLSRQLAELHGGEIAIQGSAESGTRYVISLPKLADVDSAVKESAIS
jgi:signal transduction histidine kinase